MEENQTNILVVDDDPFFRKMLPKKLARQTFLVQTAEDGARALEKFRQNPEIDLIISDMKMPNMNGLELIKTLRAENADVAFIFMTASDEISFAIEAMTQGASDYLLKDENILRTIPVAVEKVLEKHQLKKKNQQLLLDLAKKNLELKTSNQELRKLNELKNKFLGIAAHDLRNPLSSIRGLSEFLVSEMFGPLTDDQKEYLNVINTTADEMLALVNDLLDVSVIESGKLEIRLKSSSLIKLIEERIRINRVSAEKKNITIHPKIEKFPELRFDPSRISQVIDNLLSNAIKFSPRGSKVSVEAFREDSMVMVSIWDEGPGISKEDQSRLFGEFQKIGTKPTAGEKSTGLGLAIVKKIIDAHKGSLNVQSEPGTGSTFSFKLPLDSL